MSRKKWAGEWVEDIKDLPAKPGIYIICSESNIKSALYVGQSNNIKNRLTANHHAYKQAIAEDENIFIYWEYVPDQSRRNYRESLLIGQLKPKYNFGNTNIVTSKKNAKDQEDEEGFNVHNGGNTITITMNHFKQYDKGRLSALNELVNKKLVWVYCDVKDIEYSYTSESLKSVLTGEPILIELKPKKLFTHTFDCVVIVDIQGDVDSESLNKLKEASKSKSWIAPINVNDISIKLDDNQKSQKNIDVTDKSQKITFPGSVIKKYNKIFFNFFDFQYACLVAHNEKKDATPFCVICCDPAQSQLFHGQNIASVGFYNECFTQDNFEALFKLSPPNLLFVTIENGYGDMIYTFEDEKELFLYVEAAMKETAALKEKPNPYLVQIPNEWELIRTICNHIDTEK